MRILGNGPLTEALRSDVRAAGLFSPGNGLPTYRFMNEIASFATASLPITITKFGAPI
jgi:hypothetical protein